MIQILMKKVMKMIARKSNNNLLSSCINPLRISINNNQLLRSHKQASLKNHNKRIMRSNWFKVNLINKRVEIQVNQANLTSQKHPKSININQVSNKEAQRVKIKRRETRTKIKTNKRTDGVDLLMIKMCLF